MIMSIPGAIAPVVYGGKIRAVMAYLDREKLQARGLSPLDVMNALDNYNVFLPDRRRQVRRHRLRPRLELDVRPRRPDGRHPARRPSTATSSSSRDVATPKDAAFIQTNVVRVDGRRAGVHPGLPPARRQHADGRRHAQGRRSTDMKARLTRSRAST